LRRQSTGDIHPLVRQTLKSLEDVMKESAKKVAVSNPPGGVPANPATAPLSGQPTDAAAPRPADEKIRMRAYEIYRERGGRVGDDMSDWLRAEREYLEHPVRGQPIAGDADHRAADSARTSVRR
jgi:hypothetical protein